MICPRCGGAGIVHETPYAQSQCRTCDGYGEVDALTFREYVEAHPNSPAAQLFEEQATGVPCPVCSKCSYCNGSRIVSPAAAADIRTRLKSNT